MESDASPNDDVLSNAERKECTDFCQHVVTHLLRYPPPILWHYTTGSTLIKIIESGEVWATQISCLNDAQEFRHAVLVMAQAIENIAVATDDPAVADFCNRISLNLRIQDSTPTQGFFVFCLSELGDDLSQWRAYGGGEGGFALGFEGPALMKLINEAGGGILSPVTYRDEEQHNIAEDAAQQLVGSYFAGLRRREQVHHSAFETAFLKFRDDNLSWLAPLFKHRAFHEEREWRVLRGFRGDDAERLRFLQKSSFLSRHLALPFPEKRLPLKAVTVGPCRHSRISAISVNTLLDRNGYAIQCHESGVPFQTV